MGQKVNPIGFRVGISRSWASSWYSKRDYKKFLHSDMEIRAFLEQRLEAAGLSQIKIERSTKRLVVTIHASRPGVVIGKKGSDIEKLRKEISAKVSNDVSLNIVDVRKPEIDARLVADGIARQLERRASFRRAMKRAVQSAMKLGAEGIRVNVGGRLGGAEIARVEWYREGRVPLHTLRANVDFAISVAKTTYGTCGVKVWIYKGEVYDLATEKGKEKEQEAQKATEKGKEKGKETPKPNAPEKAKEQTEEKPAVKEETPQETSQEAPKQTEKKAEITEKKESKEDAITKKD